MRGAREWGRGEGAGVYSGGRAGARRGRVFFSEMLLFFSAEDYGRRAKGMLLTWCCVLGLLVLGCSSVAGGGGETAEGPRKVELRVGEETTLPDSKIRIKFLSVDDDSRCPQGVNCIWAGSVGVSLLLAAPGAEGQRVKLNTEVEPRSVSYKGHNISIESVRPPRVEGQNIRPEDYRITLAVCAEKSGGQKAGDVPDPASKTL